MPQCIACGRDVAQGAGVCPACGASQEAPGVPRTYSPPAPARQGGGMPGWAIVLIVAAVLLFVVAPVVAVVLGFSLVANVVENVAPLVEEQIDLANERAVRDGVTSIQTGLEAWAMDHRGRYPPADAVSQTGLVSADGAGNVYPWPSNPYAGGAMSQGRGDGQFLYVRGPDRRSYSLTGYGAGGVLLITLP